MIAGGCTLDDASAPPLQGPSELGLSLSLSAIPDILSLDGASQAQIIVQARDANGQPARNITFRAEIQFVEDDQIRVADCGTLSARTLATNGDGRATLTYTAPMFPCDEASQLVTIRVTPFGTDAANAIPRTVNIRLVPPGVILAGGPRPVFSVNGVPTTDGSGNPVPVSVSPFIDVTFDASGSTGGAGAGITSFSWNFGDGTTTGGQIAVHRFLAPGQYVVRLTVSNTNGQSASIVRTVTVEPGQGPVADFVFSPAEPALNQSILFNASQSTAGPGRTIVRYHWNFGSGAEQTGVTVTKSYDVAGEYNVVLTVTDDVGQTGSVAKEVSVGP
jgi:chitodextrinase